MSESFAMKRDVSDECVSNAPEQPLPAPQAAPPLLPPASTLPGAMAVPHYDDVINYRHQNFMNCGI
jgi:hypothetical protein